MRKILNKPLFIKLFNWEYWPFDLVYAPIYLYWVWLGIKARTFFFFNTSNPSIKNGGFLGESKKEIYDIMPQQYYPATLLFRPSPDTNQLIKDVNEKGLQYPLIAKPDIGMRGLGVKKVHDEKELLEYAGSSKVDFLVQDFVPFENEVGIFYYRYPGELNGHISGIVSKEFLTVKGDGISTTEQLLNKDPRYILQLATLQKSHAEVLNKVLGKDEEQLLVPYGNHSRGAKFVDVSNKADKKLTATIDKVCKMVPDFYFGRMDIRYNTWEELTEGKNFSIIELNGAGSEPTHMYDPRHSIFFAWKEIVRHLAILYKISKQNHKLFNMPYMKFAPGMQMLKDNAAYVKLITNQFDKPINTV
ncbi:D-alanine--D-alanine ligase [soil metagenome]